MTLKRRLALLAIFYPFALVACAAGFVGFIMLVLDFPPLVTSSAVLWFYFVGGAAIFMLVKPVAEEFGVKKLLLSAVLIPAILAALATFMLVAEMMA